MRDSYAALGATLLILTAMLTGCTDGSLVPRPGVVRVTVSTTGADLDPDGYSLNINGRAQAVALNAIITMNDVIPGDYVVRLDGVADNCQVGGSNTRTVSVDDAQTVNLTFAVVCSLRTGTITVTTSTSGFDPDPDGYTVTVDGGATTPVNSTGSVVIGPLREGDYIVTLIGAAANCSVTAPNPRTVRVTLAQTTTVQFFVTCTARTGVLRVTTTTTGADLDADGYVVVIDPGYYGDGPTQPIPANGVVSFADIHEGQHVVELRGIARNCVVDPPNPKTADVPYGGTTDLSFAIHCVPVGSLRVTTATAGVDPDPDGYQVSVQGERFGTIANASAIGTITLSELPAGTYQVTLGGVAANCDVVSQNPIGVVVSGGATASAAFDVACQAVTRLAFVSEQHGNPEIYLINSNGTGATRLTTNPASDLYPAWSPDGNKIAFTSDRDGNREIYVTNADGTNPVRLTSNAAPDYVPVWSPDGNKIAFTSDRDANGGAEVYVMNADGTNPVRLTNNPSYDADPAWSPDGSKIAFRSDRDGDADIYVMSADGSGVTPLTINQGTLDAWPAWSPDGTRLAFSRADCYYYYGYYCYFDLFVMNADGSAVRQVTSGGRDDVDAAWSPDGRKIAFTSASSTAVMIVNEDGTNRILLTNGRAHSPSWRR